jgi:hypothetical protein
VFHIGTDLAEVHFGQISTNMKRIENCVHETFCESLP